jgi:hypothetical protein
LSAPQEDLLRAIEPMLLLFGGGVMNLWWNWR